MKNFKRVLVQIGKQVVVALAVFALMFGVSSIMGVTLAGDPSNLNGGP